MKSAYFKANHINEVASEMLREAQTYRKRGSPLILPHNSALLVLDMQEYFLNPTSHAFIPSGPAIIPGVQKLAEAYLSEEKPVIYTQHLNTPANAGMLAIWWSDLITAANPFSKLSSALPLQGAIIVNKCQYDAFYKTDLERILVNLKVNHLVICGVMTHLCCETTARAAFIRNFEVWFAVDGNATYNRDFHQATLSNLTHGFATPVLIDEVIAALKQHG